VSTLFPVYNLEQVCVCIYWKQI